METQRQPDSLTPQMEPDPSLAVAAAPVAESPVSIDYSALADVDKAVYEAFESKGYCRMRLQPQLLMQIEGSTKKGQFAGWRGVFWHVQTQTPEQMIAIRDCLQLVFRLLTKLKASTVKAWLAAEWDRVERETAPEPHR